MLDLLQQMDAVHWWVLTVTFVLIALLRRRRRWLWPGFIALLVGFLVFLQPGMFWYRQWLLFLAPSLLLMWLDRGDSNKQS